MRIAIAGAVLLASLGSSGANACIVSDAFDALIHSELPRPLPAGTVVARVNIDDTNESALFRGAGLKARIDEMIQGDYSGNYLLLKQSYWTSCDQPFDNGKSGYIVGISRGFEGDILVVDPIRVSRMDKHRLPDGYQVPEPRRKRTEAVPIVAPSPDKQ